MQVKWTDNQNRIFRDLRKSMRVGDRKTNNRNLRRVHAALIRPFTADFKRLVPVDLKTSRYKQKKGPNSIQPYAHLKQSVKTRSVGKTGNGRGVTVHQDAFHLYFLASGTKQRRTSTGANRGRIRMRTQFISWSKLSGDKLLRRAFPAYDQEIIKPMAAQVKKEYHAGLVFQMEGGALNRSRL